MSSGDGALRRPLVLTVVGAALIALASWGGTVAAWDDTEVRPLGQVQNGVMAVEASAPEATFNASGTSPVASVAAISTQISPPRLVGTSTATGNTPQAVGWDSGLTQQVRVEHAPRDTEGVDQTVTSTNLQGNAFVRSHAGAVIQIATTVTTNVSPPEGWRATDGVTTRHRVPFPRPTHPGGGSLTLEKVCRGPLLGRATIYWSWGGADASTTSPAVAGWQMQRRTSTGGWANLGAPVAGSARSMLVPESGLTALQNNVVRVIAVPTGPGVSAPVPTFTATVYVTVGLGGLQLSSCVGATPVPPP